MEHNTVYMHPLKDRTEVTVVIVIYLNGCVLYFMMTKTDLTVPWFLFWRQNRNEWRLGTKIECLCYWKEGLHKPSEKQTVGQWPKKGWLPLEILLVRKYAFHCFHCFSNTCFLWLSTLEPQALPRTSLRNVQPITVQCTKGGRGCNELACELRDKSFISPAKTHED